MLERSLVILLMLSASGMWSLFLWCSLQLGWVPSIAHSSLSWTEHSQIVFLPTMGCELLEALNKVATFITVSDRYCLCRNKKASKAMLLYLNILNSISYFLWWWSNEGFYKYSFVYFACPFLFSFIRNWMPIKREWHLRTAHCHTWSTSIQWLSSLWWY